MTHLLKGVLFRQGCLFLTSNDKTSRVPKIKEETLDWILTKLWRQSTRERRNILNQNGKAFIKNIFTDRVLPANHYRANLFARTNTHACNIPSPGLPKQLGQSLLFRLNDFSLFLKASKHSLVRSFACLIWPGFSVHSLTEKSCYIWSEISLAF